MNLRNNTYIRIHIYIYTYREIEIQIQRAYYVGGGEDDGLCSAMENTPLWTGSLGSVFLSADLDPVCSLHPVFKLRAFYFGKSSLPCGLA